MRPAITLLLCACNPTHAAELPPQSVPADPLLPTLLPTPRPWWIPALHVRRDHHHAEVASVVSVEQHNVQFHGISYTLMLNPIAYGADAYTSIYVNGVLWAQVGINGYEHWQRDPCNQPLSVDDRFFIGLASDNRTALTNIGNTATWTNDVSVAYPTPHPYDSLTAFKVTSDNGRIRFYVEGQEIVYRDVNNVAPDGVFDNVEAVHPTELNDVKLELSVVGDGANNMPCGSVEVPFIPGSGPVNEDVVWSNINIF